MTSVGTNVILGLIAGITVYAGLIFARWRKVPETARPLLALASAGILIFLAIEVGYHAFESVETAFRLGKTGLGFSSLALVAAGLVLGLVALGIWEDRQHAGKSGGAAPQALALMTAIGIGVHNFGEGLAIGQSYASGAAALGISLVIGFALHNATEGFGIVGALRGDGVTWGRLGALGLIAGGPTVAGSVLGGFWTNGLLVTFCYSLAAGSLLFVVRELLRIPFKVPAKFALSAVVAGLLIGLVTEAVIETAQAKSTVIAAGTSTVQLRISGGKFVPSALSVQAGSVLEIRNDDKRIYTLEGAGFLKGDVPIDADSTLLVTPFREPGNYVVIVEELRGSELPVIVTGSSAPPILRSDTVLLARAAGRQPVLYPESADPAYGAYTSFNLNVHNEQARQEALSNLFSVSNEVTAETLPAELAQYFTKSGWEALRPSVAMVYGIGPPMFEKSRFGARVAASKPKEFHPIWYSKMLSFDANKTQRDVIVRVTSDSHWFNQQICRYVWRKLGDRIRGEPSLDAGYSNPNGRSPILGGFFDGSGNPIGKDRNETVFGKGLQTGGTYMAWFKIKFDQDRFLAETLDKQQQSVGRYREKGNLYHGASGSAHQVKAEADGKKAILRQPFVFDDGPKQTGLLFASVQSNLRQQFEGILCGFMMNASAPKPGTGKDRLVDYMHFQEGGYYYVPPVPHGGYPGML